MDPATLAVVKRLHERISLTASQSGWPCQWDCAQLNLVLPTQIRIQKLFRCLRQPPSFFFRQCVVLKDLTVPLFLEPVLQPIFPQWSVPLVGIQLAAPAAPIPLSQSAFAPARVLSRKSGESLSTKANWMKEQRQSYAQLWLEHQRKCMPTLVDSVPEKVNPLFPSPMSDVLPLDDDGVDGKISTGRVEDLVKPMSEREAGHLKTAIPGAAFVCQGVEAIGSHSDIFSELDEEGGQGLEELEEPKRKWKNTKYFKQLTLTESNKPLADSFQPAPPGLDEDVEVGEFGPIPRDFTDDCRCCDVCCTTKTKLKRHITAEHGRKSKESRIQCRHCAMRCATKSQLRRHIAAEHGTTISSIKWCRICFESFETVAATKEHFESHRNDEGKLPCSLCEDAFTRYETLTRHRALKHEQAGELQPQLLRKRPKGKAFSDPVTATSTKETAVNGDRIDEDNLRCQLCGERTVFENSEALLSHMRTEHAYEFLGRQAEKTTTEVRPHRCSVCSKDFQYAGTLALHFKAIHSDLPYTNCRICKEECRTFQVFKAHMKGHYVDGRLPCTHCPSTFATIVQFTKHVRANHLKRPRPPPCNICGVQLNSITCARQHKQLAHGIGEAIRGCRLCGALKKNPQSLAQHFRNHHPNESPGYRPRGDNTFKVTCTHCSGVFSNDATLERHHKDQHWKVLGLPMPRVRAVRAQPGEKECLSGPCTVCGKKFNVTGTSNGLCLRREHMQSQHGIGNYRNFYCGICGKWFKLVPLRKHFAREHPGEEPRFRDPSDNSMKRVCAFCPGVFFNKNLLERHQRKDHAKEMARGAGVLEDNGESDEEELSPDEDNLADDANQTESDSDED
ncbi:putative Zinc finger protein 26 [Hypsibius exemplaris]|uniref:Zinc finger protein 26 n=1 Tax=Hypsibius exemplaris TaxID=2072580 RepID=A0A9X6NCE0_HYPEX|nr:putative Zinc finger protein 26 [Hypsibius exemplaris]